MVTLISSFVFAGVLSCYVFLGRGLARQINEESLESRTRTALFWFTRDFSTASSIIAQDPGATTTGNQVTLSTPSGTVYYACDWSGGVGAGKLTRQLTSSGAVVTLLTNLTSFKFGYYDAAGNSITVPASASQADAEIKQAYMAYLSSAGVAITGSASNLAVVSPTVIMKNKGLLTDPVSP